MKKQTWLFVDGASEYGGHESMLLRLLSEVQAAGNVSCHLLARDGSRLARLARSYVVVHDLPTAAGGDGLVARLFGRLWTACRDAYACLATMRALSPSLCIVAEGVVGRAPIYAMVARSCRVRAVVYVPLLESSRAMEFTFAWIRDAFSKYVYSKLVSAWIVITLEQAECLREWARVRTPVFALANTVAAELETLGVKGAIAPKDQTEHLEVLVLGRLDSHQKGLDSLIEYLERTPSLAGRVRVKIVGEGYYRRALQQKLSDCQQLADFVELSSWSGKPAELIRKSDVLLICSRYEGVPLVMLEAMCLGTPVVASDLPGTRGFLAADLLFPVGDLERAFEIILRLEDVQWRRDIVDGNRETFERVASRGRFSADVDRLVKDLLAIQHAPSRPIVPTPDLIARDLIKESEAGQREPH